MALTIAILRQSRHIFQPIELPSEDLLQRLKQAVCDPPCELVERDQVVPGGFGGCLQCAARPHVAQGDSTEVCAAGGPDWGQPFDKRGPERSDVDPARRAVELRGRFKKVWSQHQCVMGNIIQCWVPISPPGRALGPKYCGLSWSAFPKFFNRDARPSRPTMGLLSVTCIAVAIFSVVSRESPIAGAKHQS